MKSKIKYTSGTLQRLCSEYYTLVLLNGTAMVYTATLPNNEAVILLEKSKTITLKK